MTRLFVEYVNMIDFSSAWNIKQSLCILDQSVTTGKPSKLNLLI